MALQENCCRCPVENGNISKRGLQPHHCIQDFIIQTNTHSSSSLFSVLDFRSRRSDGIYSVSWCGSASLCPCEHSSLRPFWPLLSLMQGLQPEAGWLLPTTTDSRGAALNSLVMSLQSPTFCSTSKLSVHPHQISYLTTLWVISTFLKKRRRRPDSKPSVYLFIRQPSLVLAASRSVCCGGVLGVKNDWSTFYWIKAILRLSRL